MDMSIFRAYDIRGIYGKTLTDNAMEDIGKALAAFMRNRGLGRKVVVANDVRRSSPALSKALKSGLASSGAEILDAGTTSFGLALFTGMRNECVTAYVTASHNPPEWNGLKLHRPDSVGFFEKDNKEVGRIAASNAFVEGNGSGRTVDMKDEYVAFMRSRFKMARRLKVVVDCGNGSTALVAPEAFRAAGLDVVELFCNIDPDFPGRGPDVKEEQHCKRLGEEVRAHGADLGVAFDGDGDRMAAVDENGRFIGADLMTVAFGREMLKAGHAKIVCNIDCSMLVERDLEPRGATVMRIPVGNTYMMQQTNAMGAALGAESSQHYVFPSYLPFDDGVVAGLKIAEMVSHADAASSLFIGLSTLPRKMGELHCADEEKTAVMKAAEELSKCYECSAIDGIKISFDDGWGLMRPSNTSPSIRLTAEGTTDEAAKRIYAELSKIMGVACKQ